MEKRKKKRLLTIGLILVGIVIVFRLALPYIVLRYVNHVLENMNGYTGHVEDIDIHLIRGAYTINGLIINRTEKKLKIPFFKAGAIDLSVQWKALFKGSLVGEIEIYNPELNFAAQAPNGQENDWKEPVKKLFPLKINRLAVINGEVHYRDFYASPHVDVFMKDVQAEVTNLTNSEKLSKTLVAHLDAHGTVMKTGKFSVKLQLDPFATQPSFDMDARMEKVNITEFNEFFKAYGKFDVQDGQIGLYLEAAARDGKIKGYVKPIIENLNVLKPKEEKLGPIQFVYEAFIEGLAEIFKNHSKDRIATRAEFAGDIKNPKINVWVLIVDVLRNAFIKVLLPGIDQSISLKDVDDKDANKKEEKEQKKEEKKAKKEAKKKEKEAKK